MNGTPNHTRVNDILLGSLERPALRWLAAHSPAWATPDMYTTIGILGGVLIFLSYLLSRFHPAFFWLASLGFIINWYGDSLDGTLARYRRIERPVYGFYIDHTTDAITQVLVFVGLGLSPYVSFNVAVLTLVAYLLLSVLVYVRTVVVGEFKISYGKLGPTEARLLAVVLNTAMFFFGEQIWPLSLGWVKTLPGGAWFAEQWPARPWLWPDFVMISTYDLFVGGVGLLLLYFFISTAYRETIRLSRDNQ